MKIRESQYSYLTSTLLYLVLLITLPVLPKIKADLGLTWGELNDKYGNPCCERDIIDFLKKNAPTHPCAQALWCYQGLLIQIAWMPPEGATGPADYVAVSRKNGHGFSTEQLKTLLYDNCNGSIWQKVKTTSEATLLSRNDGAIATETLTQLVFRSARLNQKTESSYNEKEKGNPLNAMQVQYQMLSDAINKKIEKQIQNEKAEAAHLEHLKTELKN